MNPLIEIDHVRNIDGCRVFRISRIPKTKVELIGFTYAIIEDDVVGNGFRVNPLLGTGNGFAEQDVVDDDDVRRVWVLLWCPSSQNPADVLRSTSRRKDVCLPKTFSG